MSKVYATITSRIINLLEQGVVPWRRPWGGEGSEPRNACTRRAYRGVNVFLLSAAGYDSPFFLTFRQAAMWGGHVKKGEHGFPVVFWSIKDGVDEETGKARKIFILRYYTAFNVEQCEGLPSALLATPGPKLDFRPIERCEAILAGLPANRPSIGHGGPQAFYRPSDDSIAMPKPERFLSVEDYYATLFHELTHATGHPSRLNREGITAVAPFGSPVYSREELVAEMGSAFLCGHAGIDVPALQQNEAAYIGSWLKVLRGDSRLVVQAAAAAQKAADWILGTEAESADETDVTSAKGGAA
ncbi:MAG TPA: zincin-like metallopeptidase domain-containing protein [Pirellulales bacterium]|nr:zincin-like metallopeptidase domain-containing protein [Pirellulales bacterium]